LPDAYVDAGHAPNRGQIIHLDYAAGQLFLRLYRIGR